MSVMAHAPEGTVAWNAQGEYAVLIEGVTISYGATQAVRNLSLHVPRGSIYALLGPRGSGKSTVLRALATLGAPDKGTVLVDGVDARAEPATVRSRIGYLANGLGSYEGLTVEEHLDFYGSIHGLPARRRQRLVSEALELMDLIGERARPVKSLSHSMKQQLGLARCLIHDPPILLLDDPFSALDARSSVDLQDLLIELSKLGKTVIMTSRRPDSLWEICTDAGILRDGELLVEGPVDEIVKFATPVLKLRLRVLHGEQRDHAASVLREHPLCGEVEDEGASALTVTVPGSERDVPAILRDTLSAHIEIVECAPIRRELWEIVLQLTEPEAQS